MRRIIATSTLLAGAVVSLATSESEPLERTRTTDNLGRASDPVDVPVEMTREARQLLRVSLDVEGTFLTDRGVRLDPGAEALLEVALTDHWDAGEGGEVALLPDCGGFPFTETVDVRSGAGVRFEVPIPAPGSTELVVAVTRDAAYRGDVTRIATVFPAAGSGRVVQTDGVTATLSVEPVDCPRDTGAAPTVTASDTGGAPADTGGADTGGADSG